MAKRKEIKFKVTAPRGTTLEGRQDGVVYRLHWDKTLAADKKAAYSVSAYDMKGKGRTISTAGHIDFHLDEAKEFCQQIAAGEINVAELRAKFEAEDEARKQAVRRDIMAKAKKFRTRLEEKGLTYTDLLELEVLAHSLGEMGHQMLLAYDRGEGWPDGT